MITINSTNLSIILPCLNEAQSLQKLLPQLINLHPHAEIIEREQKLSGIPIARATVQRSKAEYVQQVGIF